MHTQEHAKKTNEQVQKKHTNTHLQGTRGCLAWVQDFAQLLSHEEQDLPERGREREKERRTSTRRKKRRRRMRK